VVGELLRWLRRCPHPRDDHGLPFFLTPLALSMAALAFVKQPWGVPLYLVPTGVSAGIAATLLTALWVELYGAESLAEVRSTVEAANVMASGTSPTIMGFLLDMGVPLSAQAGACLAYILLASWIARRVAFHTHSYTRPDQVFPG